MSKEAVRAFREQVGRDPSLQEAIRTGLAQGQGVNLSALGRQHGFDFTATEGVETWDEATTNGELSDFELELVAGGHVVPCTNTSSTAVSSGAVTGDDSQRCAK